MGMIKSEKEYAISKKKVQEINEYKKQLIQGPATAPVESFQSQIQEEIKEYENLKKGIIPEYMLEIENLGLLLIGLRIKNGLTQTQLAEKLKVPPSQVSRDENNDYHGVTLPTVVKILKALKEEIYLQLAKV